MVNEATEYYRRLNLFSKVNRLAVSFYNSNPKHHAMTPIDLENDEIISFLKTLQEAELKYMLVGGFAIAFHGLVRATVDLDLWIKDENHNLEKLKSVLIQHGVDALKNDRSFDLIAGFTQFSIGESGFVIDPMKSLKAFQASDFDSCYERADSSEYKGVTFKVISRKDLLKEKRATNRPKDQQDIEHLKSLE